MSEYWKSTPKYWCKHCSTYVKDTPFERKQHESTGKHQGNLKRFLRGIQNEHEQGQRDKERAKAEVDRLNKVVGGVASAVASSSGSQRRTIQKSVTNAPTAADQKRQWAQLAEMGIEVPNDFRAELAMPGQWETAPASVGPSTSTDDLLSRGVRKRKFEGQEGDNEPANAVVQRGWGSTIRRYPRQDDADLDALLRGSIAKKENKAEDEPPQSQETLHIPKIDPEAVTQKTDDESAVLKSEPDDSIVLEDAIKVAGATSIKVEGTAPGATDPQGDMFGGDTAPVFKKRKAKSQAPTAVRIARGQAEPHDQAEKSSFAPASETPNH